MSTTQPVEITAEMKRAYLDYAMSVIVARALPDVRDGLKPVQRRILYAMYKMGLTSQSKFSKSAKVVGEVLGKFHPHGDAPVYEALVRMAQTFSMRYPLIHGQGNFGSIDGDPPAAMRYTEVKLTKIAEELLVDIEKETVPFTDNFDGTNKEPLYLPAKLPNLLLAGAEGIAVGMATKIPPHNLSEVVDALVFMIDNAVLVDEKINFNVTLDQLMNFIKGPDFPTGAIIYGIADIKKAYATGRASILIRAKVDYEEGEKGRSAIVVSELPYQVNKAALLEKIARLVEEKKIVGIADLRDESDREGIRVVIELKRDASYKKILNNLYKYTELQTTFPVNMVALVDGIPQTLSLKSILELYLRHRIEIVTKRSEFELKEAKARAHILEGLLIALNHIDEVIAIIKKSANEAEAKAKLIKRFSLSDIQAQAILDMPLKRLTSLERTKIEDDLKLLEETINYLTALLADVFKILKVIKDELLYLKNKYGDRRRTEIVKSKPGEITEEQLYENKEVIVVLTKEGYIKQVPRETFRIQQRGGKGVTGIEQKESDNVQTILSAMTHDYLLFFTNQGRVFKCRVWEVPQGTRTAKGKAVVNLINLRPDEKITSLLTYRQDEVANLEQSYILMITQKGIVKKTPFAEFANIRSNGIIAINLGKDDRLIKAQITDGSMQIILITSQGKAIIFDENEVRPTGRAAQGVKGIELEENDFVCSADVFTKEDLNKNILVIGQRGIGKKTPLSLFRDQHRGGKGIKIASVDEKIGKIAFAKIIDEEKATVVITSALGQVVKIPISSIPIRSRNAKGVILMRFSQPNDFVASATFI